MTEPFVLIGDASTAPLRSRQARRMSCSEQEASLHEERQEVQRERDHSHPEESSRPDCEPPVRLSGPEIAAKPTHVFATTRQPIRFRATRRWQREARNITDPRNAKSANVPPSPALFATPAQSVPSEECVHSGSKRHKVKPAELRQQPTQNGVCVISVPGGAKSASLSSAALLATTAPAAVGEVMAAAAGQCVHSVTKPQEIEGGGVDGPVDNDAESPPVAAKNVRRATKAEERGEERRLVVICAPRRSLSPDPTATS
jgi:hypothetical protein